MMIKTKGDPGTTTPRESQKLKKPIRKKWHIQKNNSVEFKMTFKKYPQ